MTSIELYNQFLIKFNKLGKSQNVEVGVAKFVQIYNETQRVYCFSRLKDNDNADIIDMQFLLKPSVELKKVSETETYNVYSLPSDYLRWVGFSTLAERGKCKNRVLYNKLVKPTNVNVLLDDAYNKPSFDFEETVVSISNNELQVFKSDFSIQKQLITYYRYPKSIDIKGYTTSLSQPSTTIDPEIPDWTIDKILNIAVLSGNVYSGNTDTSQLSAQLNTITN